MAVNKCLADTVIAAIEAVLFDEFPEPFDQVDIGLIWREKQRGNSTLGGMIQHFLT
jgi:hypothetical protein